MVKFFSSLTIVCFILELNIFVKAFNELGKPFSTLDYTILKGKLKISNKDDNENRVFIEKILTQDISHPRFDTILSGMLNNLDLCLENDQYEYYFRRSE